jgi:DMSO/TMAO reductase YedYZ molybdopterin-dependent catalytic subunit
VTVFLVALFANHWQNASSPTPQPSATPTMTSPSTGPSPTPTSQSPSPTPTFLSPPSPTPTSSPITLYSAEVREYNGTALSSIAGVYENAIAGTQYINVTTYKLAIFGLVNKTVQLSYDDVITGHQLYQKVVTIHCVEGWSATILWEGVLVNDLIRDAGSDPTADTIIFYASDGYTTALPRDYVANNNIILAYKMNNLTIPPERGFPFELVAESKYGYKWIKWVTGIELSNNTSYLGYWESRGYSNAATLP